MFQIPDGLRINEAMDRVRRDIFGDGDSLAIDRSVGQHRAELKSDRWISLVCKISNDLGLRASRGEGTLDEAAEWAMPEQPVVLSRGEGSNRSYFILHDHYGNRVQVSLGPDPFVSHWVSRRELEQRLGLSRDQRTAWLALARATPALIKAPFEQEGEARRVSTSESHKASSGHEHSETSPLTRILQILRPEMKEIRVIGLYALATSVLGLATPLAVEALVATVGFRMLLQQVIVLTVVLFCFLSLAAALFTVQKYVVEVIQRRIFVRIVADFAYRLPRVPALRFDDQDGPELMNRFFDIMTIQKTLAGLLTDGIYLVITTILGLAIMGFYHPYLLGFDIVLLASIAGIILILGRGGVQTSIRESRAKYETAAWLEEIARVPISIKHFLGWELSLERSDSLARSYLDARRNHFKVVYRQVLFSVMLQVAASTTLLGLGGWLVIEGQLTLGQLVASELIVAIVVNSFAKLGKYIEDYYDLLTAADKLGHIIDLPIEEDQGDILPDSGKPVSLQIKNVTVKNTHGDSLLGPLTLTVNSGEKLALTGSSGCGKSIFLALMAGHRKINHGQILIDGLDLQDIQLQSLRQQVAIVNDEKPIQGSIVENVRLGRDTLSLQEVRWALNVVGLAEKFSSMKSGLFSETGPGGLTLSSSEATRLLIARAIVGKPRLLLIDGSLDCLDSAIRERILQVLLDSTAPWTLIVVTQSSEVIASMNRSIALPDLHPLETSAISTRSILPGNLHAN